jgi:uncharacterized protein (DUF362 family)
MKISRRKFIVSSALTALGLLFGASYFKWTNRKTESMTEKNRHRVKPKSNDNWSDVLIVKTTDRKAGIDRLFDEFDLTGYSGKTVALKANYNSSDPYPASTHLDTLKTIVEGLNKAGVIGVTMAERSGMGSTEEVIEETGVKELANSLGFEVVSLDREGYDGWAKVEADWLNWRDGFYISKIFQDVDKVVQTCCLKTHRFGGHFTMSLKNSVGLVARTIPGDHHNYMRELHSSPNQRYMIAEINKFYDVDIIIMDAIEAFVNKGPELGEVVNPQLMLASDDRVALDAVGLSILRSFGSTNEVMSGKIFEQDQIRRAAEIGVGVSSADKIRLVPINDEAVDSAEELKHILNN